METLAKSSNWSERTATENNKREGQGAGAIFEKNVTFYIKPDTQSQGKGIWPEINNLILKLYLVREPGDDGMILQHYCKLHMGSKEKEGQSSESLHKLRRSEMVSSRKKASQLP